MAKFEKGHQKVGGRNAGTPNRATTTFRERLNDVVTDYYNSELFMRDLKELEPRERVAAMEKLANYVIPKMQSTSIDATLTGKQTIEDKLAALADVDEA